ncbi:MAG: cytochrome c biogenesis protein CcsA [Desulfovibrio sp.]|jgi:heme exporter protein C|nr:cytochrome c biogenesis protein CcsA [Desulfovibrio sp.]
MVSKETAYTALSLLSFVGGLALALCQWLIFVYAPIEATMRLPQKIFYLHLPLAWWGLFSFFIVFAASIAYLCTRQFHWDALAGAAAEIGVVLASLALVTGSIWGKPAWGVWWTWDARLTTTLVMCFIYTGYLIIRTMDIQPEKRSRIAAVVGILAFLDVPLVFFSARLWSYIHPPSISLEPEMKTTVFVCILAFAFIWIGLTTFRWKLACDEQRVAILAAARLLRQDHREILQN